MNHRNGIDGQQVELMGTAALTAALIREGFEIARPARDRGIDLIVFSDSDHFTALPIQVKTHTGSGFMVHRKDERFKSLVHALVWNAQGKSPNLFLFTQKEAVALLPEGKATKAYYSGSNGHWTWHKTPPKIADQLGAFAAERRWDWLRAKLLLGTYC